MDRARKGPRWPAIAFATLLAFAGACSDRTASDVQGNAADDSGASTTSTLSDSQSDANASAAESDDTAGDAECRSPSVDGTTISLAPLPVGRIRHRLVELADGDLIVMGGAECTSQEGELLSSVARLSWASAGASWRDAAVMPLALADHAAVRVDPDLVMVLGGVSAEGPSRAVLVYDGGLDMWTSSPDLPEPVERPLAAELTGGGILVVTGSPGPARAYWVDGPGGAATIVAAPDAYVLHDASLTALLDGRALLALGGDLGGVMLYDPALDSWSALESPPGFDPEPPPWTEGWIGAAANLSADSVLLFHECWAWEGEGSARTRAVLWNPRDEAGLRITMLESPACDGGALHSYGDELGIRAFTLSTDRVVVLGWDGRDYVLDASLAWTRLERTAAYHTEALAVGNGSLLMVGGGGFQQETICEGANSVEVWIP